MLFGWLGTLNLNLKTVLLGWVFYKPPSRAGLSYGRLLVFFSGLSFPMERHFAKGSSVPFDVSRS